MCGLTGFWGPGPLGSGDARGAALATVEAMAAAIRSRGPDDAGAWVDERAGLALGHRRLAVIDLSHEGHQPMETPDGRYVLVYNGEVYDYRELRRELEAEGVRFRGSSDTEVVLHALVRWGVERALGRFTGMFALALWDRAERVLVLARDRLGIKPLYYGTTGGRLRFASELKALRSDPTFVPELDRDALALFLRHAYVPGPHSIYAGIRKLVPGTYASFTAPGEPELVPYWSAREVASRGGAVRSSIGAAEAEEALEDALSRAVRDRLVADVPLGAFLSGGIDSSTVVALMRAADRGPVRTFTIGFREEGYDEAGHARAVAQHLGTEHHALTVTPAEAQAVIPSLAETWDEPFADSSQIPTAIVSRFARESVTVCLSGDGGDELFGGYPRYFLTERLRAKLRLLPHPLRRSVAAAIGAVSPATWDGLARRAPALERVGLSPGWAGYRLTRLAEILATRAEGSLYRSMVSHWKEPETLVPGSTEPGTVLTDETLEAELPDRFERMMLADTLTYLPEDILCKVDRASMAVGLEARVPLLDHRVVELAWSLPRDLRVGPAPGKRILRRIVGRHVPPELLDRPKMGFGVPIAEWLRGPLRGWAEELLDPRRLREEGVLQPEPIRRRWEEHLAGRMSWGYYLWDVLVFQAWRARWMP